MNNSKIIDAAIDAVKQIRVPMIEDEEVAAEGWGFDDCPYEHGFRDAIDKVCEALKKIKNAAAKRARGE